MTDIMTLPTDTDSEFERALALMDTMMVHGGAPVPADADGMDIKIEQKYSKVLQGRLSASLHNNGTVCAYGELI